MSPRSATIASPRLSALAQRSTMQAAEQQERCELCGEPIPSEHRHLLDIQSRELVCACRACSLLFDRRGAAQGSLRLVPGRRLALEDFALSDMRWESLRIPVDMAFFFYSSPLERVVAFYPSPMGATESRLELSAWEEIERENPVLASLQPDVEALLVNRARGARRYYLVPIEDPYRLVALIRTRWRGFTGGREVWSEIARFFEQLDGQATPQRKASTRKETTCPT